jgi:hypothetical protein
VTTNSRRQPTYDLIGLVCHIVRGSADLHGAACVGRARLFDPGVRSADLGYLDDAARWDEIQRICRTCPVRGKCWAWANALPSGRVAGPTAASVVNPLQMETGAGSHRLSGRVRATPTPRGVSITTLSVPRQVRRFLL